MDIWQDFGQKVSLTSRIREILINYPEGTSILKELVQNADDACARSVKFCLDHRHHGTGSLVYQKLGIFQGPALYAFNDAVFSEADFDSISRIGDSVKREAVGKTGRFGVGFNCCYHITDLPSFVSGSHLVLFDPHCAYLPNISASNPGKKLDFVTHPILDRYGDQASPYRMFGNGMQHHFPGTLFRFPLRTQQMANSSQVSKQVYPPAAVREWLMMLRHEAQLIMLFLKHVESIEVLEWETGRTQPRLLFSCNLHAPSPSTRASRALFVDVAKAFSSDAISRMAGTCTAHNVTFRNTDQEDGSWNETQWMVVQSLGGQDAIRTARNATQQFGMKAIPWGAIAAQVQPVKLGQADGLAFCFLPLPVHTGLPVHVNGYFELSTNRRDVWYGSDMSGMGRMRSEWNVALLRDVIGPAYVQLLVEAAQKLEPGESYSALWPTTSREPWKFAAERLYGEVSTLPLIPTRLQGRLWVTPQEAVYPDEACDRDDALLDALSIVGVPLSTLPSAVNRMLLQHSVSSPLLVHPGLVRDWLRRHAQSNSVQKLHVSHAVQLLQYCLADIIDGDVESVVELVGLPLVPLRGGSLGTLDVHPGDGRSLDADRMYLLGEAEGELLGAVQKVVVDGKALGKELTERLQTIASLRCLNLLQVHLIDVCTILLPRLLPASWKLQRQVQWDVAVASHPSRELLEWIWSHMNTPTDMSLMVDWPLLPTTGGKLLQLVRLNDSTAILHNPQWQEHLTEAVQKLGCHLVDTKITGSNKPGLSHFVHPHSETGVLWALQNVHRHAVKSNSPVQHAGDDLTAEQRTALRKFLVREHWFSTPAPAASVRNAIPTVPASMLCNTLRALPIFESTAQQSVPGCPPSPPEALFIDLIGEKYIPPEDVPPAVLTPKFVKTDGLVERRVLTHVLNVPELSKAKLYKLHVFPRIEELQSDVRETLMLTVVQELPGLLTQDKSLGPLISDLPFVSTPSGQLKAPNELYDPRIPELVALLDPETSFPSGVFSNSDAILTGLLQLGMRSTVGTETVLQAARFIEQVSISDPQLAVARGAALLEYLEAEAARLFPGAGSGVHLDRFFSKVAGGLWRSDARRSESEFAFWSQLSMIGWCPVMMNPPAEGLPWTVPQSRVAPPRSMRPPSDMYLVSATLHILDGDCRSSSLAAGLGWTAPPGASIVAAQLMKLGEIHRHVDDLSMRKLLAGVVPQLYSALSELSSDEMEVARAVLFGAHCVWVGNGFDTLDKVAFSGPLNLAPWLYVIPADLAPFKDLLLQLGASASFSADQYSQVLRDMSRQAEGRTMEATQLAQTISIVQALADLPCGECVILVPDSHGHLLEASQLVYNDAPWLTAPGVDTAIVHPKISHEVAERVGVASLRRRLLAVTADTMNLGLHSIEAFGQSESLTTRLRHIIDAYADGPAILMELMQNADDAGASEVAFMLDDTTYPTNSLLGPHMSVWQGPALLSFNDAVFSPSDFHNISRIGQDSKTTRPAATGRFGLGFNAVYHFTDLPSFVSGEYVVMFDPHAKYLPGITPAQPGLKISFQRANLLAQFPDAFQPYQHFGCDLQQYFKGTLFRFPLRGSSCASVSDIKPQPYTPTQVLQLFKSYSHLMSNSLLFLKNVRKVSLYYRSGKDTAPQLLFGCQGSTQDGVNPQQHILSFVSPDQGKEVFARRLARTPVAQLPARCSTVNFDVRFGTETRREQWLLCNAIGGGRSRDFALNTQLEGRGLMPWVGVACNTTQRTTNGCSDASSGQSNGSSHAIRPLVGQAFCFLPLPITTGLPVHVNGYFELSSNRRDIWYGSDMSGSGKLRAEWNVALLEDAVAPTYARMLLEATQCMGPGSAYLSLWPTRKLPEPWSLCVQQLFNQVKDLPVVWTPANGGLWKNPQDVYFVDDQSAATPALIQHLLDDGLPLAADMPPALSSLFLQLTPGARALRPAVARQHFRSKGDHPLLDTAAGAAGSDAVHLLLEYCVSDIQTAEEAALKELMGIIIIPLANGNFGELRSSKDNNAVTYYVVSSSHHALLEPLPSQLVLVPLDSPVGQKLAVVARTNMFNLALLDAQQLGKYILPKLLPQSWRSGWVEWTPSDSSDPTADWFNGLWDVLQTFDDLTDLEGWTLVPVQGGRLAKLTKSSQVIVSGGWTEHVDSALRHMGCAVWNDAVRQPNHSKLSDYIQSPTGGGVLNAMAAAAHGEVKVLQEAAGKLQAVERDRLRSFLLQARWFVGTHTLSSTQLEVLKGLPIFKCAAKGSKAGPGAAPSSCDLMYVDLTSTRMIAPQGTDPRALSNDFIMVDHAGELSLLVDHMGVKLLTHAQFVSEFLTSHVATMDAAARDDVMLYVLHNTDVLATEDPDIVDKLSKLAFVPTASGQLFSPAALYDPRNQQLRNLLDPQTSFPTAPLATDTPALDKLIALGLRTHVSPQVLLEAAEKVESSQSTDPMAVPRAKAVLAEMNSMLQRDGEASCPACWWSQLSVIAWCPVLVTPPEDGLPWPTSAPPLAAPKVLRPMSDMWCTSACMRVLDGECSDELAAKFGWDAVPPPNVLAAQLLELGKMHGKVESEQLLSKLREAAGKLYGCMSSHYRQGSLNCEVMSVGLEGSSCVWVGDGFKPANVVAVNAQGDFRPYLYGVPLDLSQYAEVFHHLGVADHFTTLHFVLGLEQLARHAAGKALTQDQLELGIQMSTNLGRLKEEGSSVSGTVYLPDAHGLMAMASVLYYNDAAWLADSGLRMCHPDIPNAVAESLGVQSLRYHHQVDQQMTHKLPCPPPLVLQQLLSDHMISRTAVLMDIAEVADAAGASGIEVYFDERQHSHQSLLHPGLCHLQGPALCLKLHGVTLSTDELCSLQLPQSPYKLRGHVCHYGSGLMAAYAATDVPMIISGGYLHIWDPRGRYLLEGSSEAADKKPLAKQYRLLDSDLTSRFSDQFRVWDFGSPDVAVQCPGVLIRLPLRLACGGDAGDDVSKVTWDAASTVSALDSFCEHIGHALLFMRNLRVVRAFRWAAGAEHAVPVGEVSLVPHGGMARAYIPEREWKRAGSGFMALGRKFVSGRSEGSQRVVSFELVSRNGEGVIRQESWLVSAIAGAGTARDIATDKRNVHLQLDPWVAIAIKTSADPKPVVHPTSGLFGPLPLHPDVAGSQGPAFCQLNAATNDFWGFPFLIGGHFWINRNGGRTIFLQPSASTATPPGLTEGASSPQEQLPPSEAVQSVFNRELMFCLGTAWIDALKKLRDQNKGVTFRGVYHMIPHLASAPHNRRGEDLPHSLARTICRMAGSSRVWQLQGGQFVYLREGCFLQPTPTGVGPLALEFIQQQLPVFDVPWEMKSVLEAAGVTDIKEVTPATVRPLVKRLFKSASSAPAMNPHEAVQLLAFCFGDVLQPQVPPQPQPQPQMQPAGAHGSSQAGSSGAPGFPEAVASTLQNMMNTNWAPGQSLRTLGEMYFGNLMSAANEEGPPAPGSQSSTSPANPVVLSNLHDCQGLPIPTASGRIVQLGAKKLYIWSQNCRRPPIDVFPSTSGLWEQFINPLAVTELGLYLAVGPVRSSLRLPPYSVADLPAHLDCLDFWTNGNIRYRFGQNNVVYRGNRPQAWKDGSVGGPPADWLLQLWELMMDLQRESPSPEDSQWDVLSKYTLLPTTAGDIAPMSTRHLIMPAVHSPLTQHQAPHGMPQGTTQSQQQSQQSPPASILENAPPQSHDMMATPATNGMPSTVPSGDQHSSLASPSHHSNPFLPHTSVPPNEERGGQLSGSDAWDWLLPMLQKMAAIVLDSRFAVCNEVVIPVAARQLQDVVLRKMRLCAQHGILQFSILDEQECMQLFRWFAAGPVSTSEAADGYFLKQLPIFPTVSGSCIALGEGARPAAMTCNETTLNSVLGGAQKLPQPLKDRFLLHDPQYLALYSSLGVTILDEGSLLADAVLPHFTDLDNDCKLQILSYIHDHWGQLQYNSGLIRGLEDTPFVDCGGDVPKSPCDLFDPDTPLLARLFKEQPVFPQGRFAEQLWLRILRSAGLKCEVDAATFAACARQLSSRWQELQSPVRALRDDVWECGLMMAKYINDNCGRLHASSMYTQLNGVNFVPAVKGIPASSGSQRVLTSYDVCAHPKDWRLCWTAVPILDEAAIPPQFMWTGLGIRSPPRFETIAEHLRKVGVDGGDSTLSCWPASAGSVEDVFNSTLKYLQDQGLSSEQANQLKGCGCVAVGNGTALVPPSRCFVRLREDLAPFAYEIPPAFTPSLEVLKQLGTRDSPTVPDLLDILSDIQKTASHDVLNINELRAVARVLKQLCAERNSAERHVVRRAVQQGSVWLPAVDHRLVHPATCVCAVNSSSRLLERLDTAKLSVVHPRVPASVCQHLGLPLLEEAVAEVLHNQQHMKPMEAIQGIALESVRSSISTPAFCHAVHAVMREHANAVHSMKLLEPRELAKRLQEAAEKLQFVSECHTRLVLVHGGMDVTRPNTPSKVYEFTDVSSGCIYAAEPPLRVPLSALLSRAISRFLGLTLPLPLDAFLACPPATLPSVQAALTFTLGGTQQEGPVADLARAEAAGKLGAQLQDSEVALLQLRPLRPYSAGELVAYRAQVSASEAAALAAASRLRGSPESTTPWGPLPLLYGRIAADCRPPAGAPLYRVPVEVQLGETREILSSELFAFKQAFTGGRSSIDEHGAAQTPVPSTMPGIQPVPASIPAASHTHTQLPSPASRPGPSGGESSGNFGGVGGGEVVTAVREMLSAAGLSLDVETGTLMEQVMTLKQELTAAESRVQQLEQNVVGSQEEVESLRSQWTCRICVQNEVDAGMKSCGHMLCHKCASSVRGRCPFCRQPSAVMRLYK